MTKQVFLFVAMSLSSQQLNATTMLIDDFNDGNDDGWTHLDVLDPAWGPAKFDASSGAYNLSSSGIVGPTGGRGMAAVWDASSAPLFSQGFLKAKVRAETDGTSLFLLMRGNVSTGDAYSFHAGTAVGFQIRRLVGFTDSTLLAQLDASQFPFSAGEDWMMEAGAVNNELSLKVWRVGYPEPTSPQLRATDSTYSAGLFAVDVSTFPRQEVLISGTFDGIYFTAVPEPSSLLLVAVGCLSWLFLGFSECQSERSV